jgi:two-component system, OmpR family, phosphate regulon sensor histidine kinase PhoR
MKNNSSHKTQFIFFYLMIVYVFAFLFWWTYLLYKKTEQHYTDTLKFESLRYELSKQNNTTYTESETYRETYSKFQRQKIMIIAEGSVFFLILLIGMIKIRHSFVKEVQIARQQKNFILSITHEFKSPIASVKLIAETLKKRELPREKQEQLLNNSLGEVERLENLVENILLTAKIENNRYGFSMQTINLSKLIEDLKEKIKFGKTQNFDFYIEESLQIEGDNSALTSVILNLTENACKYSPPNSTISISAMKNEDTIVVRVADNGRGISEEEKSRIFEKFYRVGSEETRHTKGTGLGLYIVKQLVNLHSGNIEVLNNSPSGTIFQIDFPAK